MSLIRQMLFSFLFLLALTVPGMASSASQPSSQLVGRVRNAVESYVIEKLALSPDDVIIDVSFVEKREYMGKASDELRVLPSEKGIQRGLQYVTCGVFSNDRMLTAFRVKVRIQTFESVVVTRAKTGRHEILDASHLALTRRETTSLQQKYYTAIAAVAGMRAKRILREGEIITASAVEPVPLVLYGSELDIHFKRGALVIKLPGVARGDGHLGAGVQIKCLENNRIYEGVVVDARTVEVNL